PAVQVARIVVRLEAAALQKTGRNSPCLHLARQGDPGHAAAYDAYRRLDGGALLYRSGIDKHYCSLSLAYVRRRFDQRLRAEGILHLPVLAILVAIAIASGTQAQIVEQHALGRQARLRQALDRFGDLTRGGDAGPG